MSQSSNGPSSLWKKAVSLLRRSLSSGKLGISRTARRFRMKGGAGLRHLRARLLPMRLHLRRAGARCIAALNRRLPVRAALAAGQRALSLGRRALVLLAAAGMAAGLRLYSRLHQAGEFLAPRLSHLFRDKIGALLATGRTGVRGKIGAMAMASAFTVIIGSSYFYHMALAVSINGEFAGYVRSEEELEEIIASVEEYSSEVLGEEYTLTVEVDSSTQLVSENELMDKSQAENLLISAVEEIDTLAVVRVDDVIVGAVEDIETAEAARDEYIQQFVGDHTDAQVELLQPCTIEMEDVDVTYLTDAEGLKAAFAQTVEPATLHTIQAGETIESIAQAYGLQVTALASMNPALQSGELPDAGTDLVVSPAQRRLNVQVTRPISYEEYLPYETIETESDELTQGTREVTQQGQAGSAQVEATLVTLNGIEQEREILSRVVTAEPVDELITVGTKEPVSTDTDVSSGSGWMILPFNGRLSSNYGYRWGSFHRGIDLAGSTGSPVVAAASGTVVLAGWNGTYGYCVIISHGNGLETLYAHNSSLNVSVGETVSQGELIARVGSTGRSTGPHCHFEVRVNGDHVNPWNYLQ